MSLTSVDRFVDGFLEILHDNPIFAERRVERYEGTYTCAMSEVGFHIIMLHTKPDIRFSNQAPHTNKFACPVNEWKKLSYFVNGIGPWIIDSATKALDCYECLCSDTVSM